MNANVTYKQAGLYVKVYLNAKHVGTIKASGKGWRYCPFGGSVKGEVLVSIEAVKRSLESE